MVAMTSPLHRAAELHFVSTVTFFANCSQTPASTSNLSTSSERQWNVDSNDLLSVRNIIKFSRTSRIHFCYKICHWSHWANGGKLAPKSTPSSWGTWIPSNTWMPGVTPSPPKRQFDCCTHCCTTMQQKPHWLQWYAPNSSPKTVPSLQRSPALSNTPIPWPIPLTTPNGIRIQSAVLSQYTLPTDRTDQPTDGLKVQANVP